MSDRSLRAKPTTTGSVAATRRTQGERTATTVASLLESTISAIVELGYARATTREICQRAGVSQGGLFRHFASRRDLVVAAIERLNEDGRNSLDALLDPSLGGFGHELIVTQLRAIRDFVRDPRRIAYLEVIIAARTEPDLRSALGPTLDRQDRAIMDIALRSPLFATLSAESRAAWLDIAIQTLWVEALWRTTLPDPELDDAKLAALVRLAFVLAERDRRTSAE